ncbi:DNA repair protein RAD50-like isoform X1 [Varroa destructor]|uniref:Zinc-hook domain-containing protein n=1 Tax=Varroa destructor TaxID=109461 RepID=A0A7M7KHT7_VARDE|nr:DNA repair protein RAD50-like isoform X1 [Varroa destructor]
MSRISKLSIRGIRGFGPEESDTQRITFTPPLTLILGHNGAGKSTIIECLRMMTTSDMPPGQGQCFIHDPSLSGKATTHAKIEMRLTDAKDRSFDVSKIFALTRKDKTFKFSTTDTTINNLENNQSMGSKCCDVNSFMSQSLGVPKAVLQNVIFCHHSESDWPLGEGKALKERFDAIFSATKYVEVLEVLNKEKKEVKAKVNELEALRRPITEKLTNYKNDLQAITSKKSRLDQRKAELDATRRQEQEVSKERAKIDREYHEFAALEQEYVRRVEEYKSCKNRLDELQEGVQEVMDLSREELEEELKNFDQRMADRKQQVEQSKLELRKMKDANEKKWSELREKESSLVRLEGEYRQHEQAIQKMLASLRSLNRALDAKVDIKSDDYAEHRIDGHVNRLDEVIKTAEGDLAAKKKHFSKEIESLQAKIRDETEQKASYKTRLDSLRNKQDELMMEMALKNQELKEVASIGVKMDQFDEDIRNMKESVEKLKKVTSESALEKLTQEIEDIACKESQFNEELNSATKNSAARNKIKTLENQISKKAKAINTLKLRMIRELKEPFAAMELQFPSNEWARVVKGARSTLDDEVTQLRKTLEAKTREMTKCQTELDMGEKELTKLQHRLKELRDKIDDEVGLERTLDETIIETEEQLNEMRNQDSIFIGTQHIYTRYKKKMAEQRRTHSEQCCPLCERSMVDSEVKNLDSKLERLMSELPKLREGSKKEVTDLSDKLGTLNLLKRDDQEKVKLEDDQIPALEKHVRSLRDQLRDLTTQIEELQKQLEMKSEMSAALNSQIGSCDMYDSGVRELDGLRSELKKEQVELEEDCRDVDDVMVDINEAKENRKKLEKEWKSKQDQMQELNNLQVKLSETKNSRLKLINKAGQETQIKQALEKLEKENVQLDKDLPEIEAKLSKVIKSLDELESSCSKLLRQQERQIEDLSSKLLRVKQEREDLSKALRSLEEYEQSGKKDKMNAAKEEVVKQKSVVKEARNEYEEKEELTRQLEVEVSRESSRRRELSDNIAVIDKKAELQVLKKEVTEHKQLLEDHNLGEESILKKLERIKAQHEELKGQELTKASDVRNLEQTLAEEEARAQRIGGTAEKEFKEWLAENLVEKQLLRDIDIGYAALNKAILAFHQEKMSLINKIIHDLWINVYKGNDIENIEIKFNEDTGSTSKSTTKRNYQYRVVMKRQGGIEQDMRSRCSAGQRVLASLIVRLALAEAFCDGCAMLALDEPTTNLDHENMMSLAETLAEIVRKRKTEKNFQMVVITHDESFVIALSKCLHDIGEVRHYYKVEKNEDNLSEIRKRNLDFEE